MDKIETPIKDLYIIQPRIFGDERGWFYESWSQREFERLGIPGEFVQDNQSFSATKGTLRGLHFQKGEDAQAKLVRCLKGAVLDIAVDLRKHSPTFLKWYGVELTEENKKMLYIPRGFAHGFLTLTNQVEFAYKADNFYKKEAESAIRYDDPDLNIDWKLSKEELEKVIVSSKDQMAPFLKDCSSDHFFE